MNSFIIGFLESLLAANAHFTITSAKRTPEQNKAAGGVLIRNTLQVMLLILSLMVLRLMVNCLP